MLYGWSLQGNLCLGLQLLKQIKYTSQNLFTQMNIIFQRLQLDRTVSIDPLTLLEKISTSGISQDVCVNDLGKNLESYTIWLWFTFGLTEN